jgi:hypothetical protein
MIDLKETIIYNDFEIDFQKNTEMNYSGVVYPIVHYENISKGTKGTMYLSKTNDDTIITKSNECKVMFQFSFCWRGVWEGRLYFIDDEYWGEDLSDMNETWDYIVTTLKDKIKNENKDYKHFDK